MFLALAFAVVVAVAATLERPIEPVAAKPEVKSTTEPLVRSDPGVDPWVERDIPPPRSESTRRPSSPQGSIVASQSVSTAIPDKRPESEPGKRPWPFPDQNRQTRPLQEDDFPLPTVDQIQAANNPRHYNLPPGAIMSLTINTLGLNSGPVLSSNTTRALDQGVIHLPNTSLPWSETPERNVYIAGHRLGWPRTGSHLIFYRLNELKGGERITLRGATGKRYDYRVIDSFAVWPDENWVTGRVRDRDLLTLQTCTPIPTFEKRLIIRAERT
jgi:sortase A